MVCMKFLFDLFPIFLFFVAYKYYDIFVATIVAIVATLFNLIYSRIKSGKYQNIHLVSFFSILILGGATLIFKNEMFIKWKTTCVYWVLSLVFLFTQIVQKKPLIKKLAQQSVTLPERTWGKLNICWSIFFTLMGFANLFVAYNFETDIWVNFKLFGTLGLTLAFIIAQGIYMAKYIKTEDGKIE